MNVWIIPDVRHDIVVHPPALGVVQGHLPQ
jgi:hypothetical protein